jgi:hypothetical protein
MPGVETALSVPSWKAFCSGELARVGQPLDGLHFAAVGLHREHQAAAYDLAVHAHGASTTYAVLAAQVRASEAELLTQEVHEVRAGRDAARDLRAVDGERDV